MSTVETPQRAAVVVAHPDDPDFTAAGTLARWTDSGADVTLVIVTDGSKGTAEQGMLPHDLIRTRIEEQRAAAAVLGIRDVVFLGEVDGEVVPDLALRRRLTSELRRLRPDTVVTHDPARFYTDTYINHPDHRAVGQATLDAVFPTARDHLNVPFDLAQGVEPHKVTTVLLVGAVAPDVWSDISATFERKIEALRRHASQIKDMDQMRERVAKWATDVGAAHGYTYAEAFKRITLPLLLVTLAALSTACGGGVGEESGLVARADLQPTFTALPPPLPSHTAPPSPTPSIPYETPTPDQFQEAGLPVRLEIPAIDVDAAIEHVGVNELNQMDVPKLPQNVAWYDRGPLPGQVGNAVISGHLDSATAPAVFYDLRRLIPGDELVVTYANNARYVFRVASKERYGFDQVPLSRLLGHAPGRNLNLITCDGAWDGASANYQQRLVVYTRLVDG